ncbi:MAG TPA: single-stranded-DNA-specific exonuclease RecJ [Nitrospirales bacterium]|nr:single-stranded-DNA-specific exonuclease RecJ [Nitrospirales bacterium]
MPAPLFKEWVMRPSDPEACRVLADTLGLHRLTAAILVARGHRSLEEARAVLDGEEILGPDPFLLAGMEQTVDRLHRAVRQRERVLVYGDYDVDGASATSLYLGFLKGLGLPAEFYIPHRIKEGYGLNAEAIRRIAASGVSVLITADCGTTSIDEIALAQALGMDVIVTDHHLPGDTLPPAFAVLNPCRSDSGYPFSGLCSGGLAYKVASAYRTKYGAAESDPDSYLDLVALATIADVAPLREENRTMVRQGLRLLSRGDRPGIRALKAAAGVMGACGVGTVGFILAPRINAAGRLGDAADAVRLLVTHDEGEAAELAGILNHLNQERQQLEERMTAEALQAADATPTGPIVLASRGWHQGVVGVVAARLVERFHRPAVLIALNEEGIGRGSARSIAGVNLYEAIARCRDQLLAFGGHAVAAGLTITEECVPAFRDRLAEALEGPLSSAAARPQLFCDAEVEPHGFSPRSVGELTKLGPFGAGNPEPTLVLRSLRIASAKIVGANHLKLTVQGRGGPLFDAIGFRMGSLESRGLSQSLPVDVACALDVNTWNGAERVQLRLKDVRTSVNG